MSRNTRFRYPLEPVLLSRQWDHDALLLDLNKANQLLTVLQDELAALIDEAKQVATEWNRQSGLAQHISVDRFTIVSHYMQDLAKRRSEKEKEIQAQEQERDLLIDRAISSRQGLDAVEQHRDKMQTEFIKIQISGDLKLADDQWSTLQARKVKNDSES
jgi:flagellar biosynthesis chaperone FliJ